MSAVPVFAAVVVGAVLIVSGASKLAARESWPPQARALGAPGWSIGVVPWLELVVGAMLVVQLARRPMAIVAIGLFGVFTVLIAANLRQGRHPPCACFGAWSAKPIGGGTIARNLALIAVAVVAAL